MNKRENAQYVCDKCGELIKGIKAYYIIQHQHQNPNRKGYCSAECTKAALTKERHELECVFCKKEFNRLKSDIVSKNNFCSQSCAAKYNNALYVKRLKKEGTIKIIDSGKDRAIPLEKIYKVCPHCNKEFEIYNRKSKYCSLTCSREYKKSQRLDEWKKTGIDTRKTGSVSATIKNYLLKKHDNKCSRCGWHEINPVTNKPPLEVEHIDGNSKNNIEENLTILCPNCHALTTAYKALNKGNGRHNRMQRYNNGKSF